MGDGLAQCKKCEHSNVMYEYEAMWPSDKEWWCDLDLSSRQSRLVKNTDFFAVNMGKCEKHWATEKRKRVKISDLTDYPFVSFVCVFTGILVLCAVLIGVSA